MRKKKIALKLVALLLIIAIMIMLFFLIQRDGKRGGKDGRPGIDQISTTTESSQVSPFSFDDLKVKSTAAVSSPFGMFGATGSKAEDAKYLGIQSYRFNLPWNKYEPTKGDYQLDSLSKVLSNFGASGKSDAVITLVAMSDWGGNQVGTQQTTNEVFYRIGYPSDPEAWTDMVKYTVEKLDGDGKDDLEGLKQPVKYWQVENEWQWQWVDTIENYVKFVELTSKAVKEADPGAKIVLGGIMNIEKIAFADGYITDRDKITLNKRRLNLSPEQVKSTEQYKTEVKKLDYVLQNTTKLVDIIDVHIYGEDPYIIDGTMNWTKDRMKRFGSAPIYWSTENAGPFGGYTVGKHSEQVVQRYLIGVTSGIERLYWASMRPSYGWQQEFLDLALVPDSGVKKPAFYTYSTLTEKMNDVDKIEQIQTDEDIYAYRLSGGAKSTYVVWQRKGNRTLSVPYNGSAMVTSIITRTGQTEASVQTLESSKGKISIKIDESPVFIEFN